MSVAICFLFFLVVMSITGVSVYQKNVSIQSVLFFLTVDLKQIFMQYLVINYSGINNSCPATYLLHLPNT